MLDQSMTPVEMMQQARELAQRLKQLQRDIERLGELADGADLSLSSVDEWLQGAQVSGGWLDITILYKSYADWMTQSQRPPLSLKRFCMILHKSGDILSRKHPSTRRVQVWF